MKCRIVYNIPPTTNNITEAISVGDGYATGVTEDLKAKNGRNDLGKEHWSGPVLSKAKGRTITARLYAVKTEIDIVNANRAAVLSSMRGKVLGKASITAQLEQRT